MMRRQAVVIAVVIMLAGGGMVAQEALSTQGGRTAGPPVLTPGEIQRWLDAYTVLNAAEQLELSEDRFPEFVARLKALQTVRRHHQQTRQQLLNDLRMLVGRPRTMVKGDEAQVQNRLQALRDLEARTAGELQKTYDGVDELLDPVQRARFRLFEDEMERRKLDLLSRARRLNQARRGGPG